MSDIQSVGFGDVNRSWRTAVVALTVFLLASVFVSQQAFAADAINDSVASADGIMIHYTAQGSGSPALVFVHGWCMNGSYWDNQVAAFKDKYTVVTLDLAGHGLSGSGRKEWTMPAFGADVAAVVNRLDLKKVILVGHSMGGAVIIEAARLLGDRVLGLIGVDTYQDLSTNPTEQQVQQFQAALSQNFPVVTKVFVRQLFGKTADTALMTRVADSMSQCVPEVGLGAMKNLMRYDAAAALKEMRKPIRSINANIMPTNVEANKKVASSFEVTFMPGYGHFLFLEDPQTFDSLLTKYVVELSGMK